MMHPNPSKVSIPTGPATSLPVASKSIPGTPKIYAIILKTVLATNIDEAKCGLNTSDIIRLEVHATNSTVLHL